MRDQYIYRNLIISEGLARTIPNSELEQAEHIQRAISQIENQELIEKLSNNNLSLEDKRQAIWSTLNKNKKINFIKLFSKLTYLTLILVLLYSLSYLSKFIKPHKKWTANYYANMNLENEAIEEIEYDNIFFDWTEKSPSSKVDGGKFSAKFKSCMNLKSDDILNIKLGSDDGSRLLIDNNKVLESWKTQGFEELTSSYPIKAGKHSIEIQYFQNGGATRLEFEINSSSWENAFLKSCK